MLNIQLPYEYKITSWSNFSPSLLLKRNESICPHKDLYKNVLSSFVYYNKHLKETKMSINPGMGTQIVVHAHDGILFGNKKGWIIDAKKKHPRITE